MSRKHRRRKKNNKRNILWWCIGITIGVIICIAVGAAVLVYDQNNSKDRQSVEDNTDNVTGTAEAIQRADASYERWLAAGMVTAISMQYPDFSIEGIYLSGETALSDKSESAGAYVVFTADGAETAIHSVPLDAERTDAGTTDLYTRDLGFATFDTIDPSQIDTGSCEQIEMDDLTDLISQSLLVSLYEH